MLEFFNQYKDAFDALQACATVLALIIGAYWTWWIFIGKRTKYARAEVSHTIKHRQIAPHKVLLQVWINVKNIGESVIKLNSWFIWIQQVEPVVPEFLEKLANNEDLIDDDENQIKWPSLYERYREGPAGFREIEPGVQDRIYSEFILDIAVQTIMVYTYIDEPTKSYVIGWETTSVYDIELDRREATVP